MTTEKSPYMMPIKEFVAWKQVKLFRSLKQQRFTGKITFQDKNSQQWTFYLYIGRVLYATGGVHPVRRWLRNLAAYAPNLYKSLTEELENININLDNRSKVYWEYEILNFWLKKQQIARETIDKLIRSIIQEIFFDITQVGQVVYKMVQGNFLPHQLILIDPEPLINQTWQLWTAWCDANIADRSPNSAPVIRQPEQLRIRTNPHTYQLLTKYLNGKYTLRDLARQTKRNLVQLTLSLMPYIQKGYVELINIADLLPLVEAPRLSNINLASSTPISQRRDKPLVACIDDSLLICQSMEKIITAAGYKYMSDTDGVRGIARLIMEKPDFIFLDLVMPNANGYELCAQVRRLELFNQTPVVIFTASINLIDRMKAKMAGCSELLPKPVDAKTILNTITKYLGSNLG